MRRGDLYPAIGLLGTGPNATVKYCKLEIENCTFKNTQKNKLTAPGLRLTAKKQKLQFLQVLHVNNLVISHLSLVTCQKNQQKISTV
jgi:hypothetical protein